LTAVGDDSPQMQLRYKSVKFLRHIVGANEFGDFRTIQAGRYWDVGI
jgi:hypothetical protein